MRNSMRSLLRALAVIAVPSLSAFAQQQTRGATIAGTVRDSSSRPIAGADVVAQPGNHRIRSDSAGNFVLTGLDGGAYTVAARKGGYGPDRWDVSLSKSGRDVVKFVLGRRVQLDAVVVDVPPDCTAFSLDAFESRRQPG